MGLYRTVFGDDPCTSRSFLKQYFYFVGALVLKKPSFYPARFFDDSCCQAEIIFSNGAVMKHLAE